MSMVFGLIIECCIDKWASGTWSPIKFTVNDYESLYHLHVANLNEFEDYMKEFIMLPKMIRVLHNNGHIHARANPIEDIACTMSLSAFSTVIEKFLNGGQESETETEQEEESA
ncbi:hypothetical protein FIBSPDRAFT_897797 [Athelia psychrophila]|uniref:DUF6532 domain-containing protein n=1 Tax=Athelia psychrophila TaxID=1759441 RepID=A0A166BRR7_9AGAM|nr:hypothetical protein FIBSPDRAFT_897797 [Fibularhizoctonia sp. CBS 109695]